MGEHKQQSRSLSGGQLAGYIALCLIWGSTWLAIRVVVRDVPPLEAAALRFLAAGVLLLGMALAQKRPWPDGAAVERADSFERVHYGCAVWLAVLG